MGSEVKQWMHIEMATTLPVAKDIVPLHDALRATEKALGDAEWDSLDTTYLKQELASLRLAQRVLRLRSSGRKVCHKLVTQ